MSLSTSSAAAPQRRFASGGARHFIDLPRSPVPAIDAGCTPAGSPD